MTKNNSSPGNQDAAGPYELIPAPEFSGSSGFGAWPQPAFGGDAGRGDLARYLHALRRRWLMAVVIALPISATAAFAAWVFLPRLYTSTAILRLASVESMLIFETADA